MNDFSPTSDPIYGITIFGLWKDDGDGEDELVCGTECSTKAKAEMLLSDRIANGEAFDGEHVAAFSVTPARYRAIKDNYDRF